MKQFSETNFNEKLDIQIQVPTCRLHFNILVPLAALALNSVLIRARLVTPAGPTMLIERTPILDLFEIASLGEGFHRIDYSVGDSMARVLGHIEIARDGALQLNTGTYVSLDITSKEHVIASAEVFALQHSKNSNTYLHYNPVTINQALQSVPLEKATHLVMPIARVHEVQLTYPTATVSRTSEELRSVADASNDVVSVIKPLEGVPYATYGYNRLVIVPVRDPLSMLDASRVQIERNSDDPGAFNVILVEEKSL